MTILCIYESIVEPRNSAHLGNSEVKLCAIAEFCEITSNSLTKLRVGHLKNVHDISFCAILPYAITRFYSLWKTNAWKEIFNQIRCEILKGFVWQYFIRSNLILV